jgi:arabinofuranan 3-O-arabinosyltransferase
MPANTALGEGRPCWGRLWSALASEMFLSRERAVGYSSAVCLGYLLILPCLWLAGLWPLGADGHPVEADFVNVWAAGFLAAKGEAAAVYDWAVHQQAEVLALGRDSGSYASWHYPPVFLFAAAPLALLPYLPAWLLWIAANLLVFVGVLRRLVLPAPGLVALALAAPTTLFCALLGQNGFLTAGLMAGSLALLDRRPWLAGALLGLLTYKPQYGLLFPLVLVLARRWGTIAAAALSASALAGASALVFGVEVWAAFAEASSVTVNGMLRRGGSDWSKLQSFYAFFHQAAGSDAAAWAVHLGAASLAAAAVVLVWLRGAATTPAVRSAALIAGAYLVTPYAYIYDAVVLTAASVFLLKDGVERGFRPFDKSLLCLSQLLPGVFFLGVSHSLVAPASAALLLFLSLRRSVPCPARRDPVVAVRRPAPA